MPRLNWFQKLVRSPFKLIPKEAVLPILTGPIQGSKWVYGASNISYWLGTYESAMAKKMWRDLNPGDTFFDLGAHVGYYSLLAAKKVGPEGKVVSAEPLPRNLDYLVRHLELNRLNKQVEVVSAAVSDANGKASFRFSNAVAAKMDEEGQMEVEVMALKDLLKKHQGDGRLFIKMDIEGQELKTLESVRAYLSDQEVYLYLSTHGKQLHLACMDLLMELNYQCLPLDHTTLNEAREVFAFPA